MSFSRYATVLAAVLAAAACGGTEGADAFGSSTGAATDGGCVGELSDLCDGVADDSGDDPSDDVGPGDEADGDDADGDETEAPRGEPTCVKIEDAEIGRLGIEIDLGAATITIDGWTEKLDSPGEQVGFDWTVVGETVDVVVKTGGERHGATLEDGTGTWLHPNGLEGPEVPAISHVVFCADAAPGDDGDGSGDDGSGDDGSGDDDGDVPPPPVLM